MNECVIIDTNVFAVAEGLNDDASEACVASCVALARRVQEGLPVTVDDSGLMLAELIETMKKSRSAGIGVKLAASLWRRRYDPQVCHQVTITPSDNPPGSFSEVPTRLRDFDVDDHKFLAIAVAHGPGTQVFQALDQEWWVRRRDFAASGIDVQFVCATELVGR